MWLRNKMSDEGGLLLLVLAIVGVVAIISWAVRH